MPEAAQFFGKKQPLVSDYKIQTCNCCIPNFLFLEFIPSVHTQSG